MAETTLPEPFDDFLLERGPDDRPLFIHSETCPGFCDFACGGALVCDEKTPHQWTDVQVRSDSPASEAWEERCAVCGICFEDAAHEVTNAP